MSVNGQTRTARRKQKKMKKKPLWKRIILIGLLVLLAIGVGTAALFTYYIATAPSLDESKLVDTFSSEIYDMDEEVFGELGSEKRSEIKYDELPDKLIDAVTATEDARFFKHHGIDMRRIGGAIMGNVLNGFGSQGASTITQQVVEKSFLSNEKKIKRKVQEQWLSLKLERNYTKEEIMEIYLNKIFYGNNTYGVAKAAENYFGVTDLDDLTLPEAAILAGLPQRPSAYNPLEHPENMKERMDTVLKLMVRHDKITEEEADEARDTDIESLLADQDDTEEENEYQAFLDQVNKEVKEKTDGADIYTDGLKVYTTLDSDIQDHVEFLLSDSDDNPINYPDDKEDDDGDEYKFQAGMTVLDTETGAIRSIGGEREEDENHRSNYAIPIGDYEGNQPGSSIKPIADYGPAIEHENWSTYHQIHDDESIHGIDNFDNQFHGWVSLRTALSQSYNIPAVKTFQEIGPQNAADFAEGLGIDINPGEVGEAIGGTESNVTPLDMAGAFRAFGNEGIYNEPYAVEKVEFPDGEVVELDPEPEAVMSDSTAYMITDVLKDVITEGTASGNVDVGDLPMAAKTGTTNLEEGEEGSPDSWLTGYTTNYTMSIWTGYKKNLILPDTKIPHAILENTMKKISEDIDTPDFEKPDSVVEKDIEKGSNPAELASDLTPESDIVTELFVKDHEPDDVSEKFDELDPVEDLSAEYDDDAEEIKVDWDYDSDEDVSFEISASEDGGDMESLSSTEDTSFEIGSVEPGSEYEIEVVVVDNDGDLDESEAETTKVNISDEDDEDNDDEDMEAVDDLSASFKEDEDLIDVSWSYDGPPASFEVDVDGQKQTTDSNGLEISGASPGETHTITVTAIGSEGANEGVESDEKTTEVTIPEDDSDENEDGNNNENNNGNNNGNNNENGNNNANENNGENENENNEENEN